MALVASDILRDAQKLLQDPDGTRWTLEELTHALNDGMLEACLHKPSAFAEAVVLTLSEGTWQTLAAGQSQFMRAVRNITDEGPPRVAGDAITPIERDALDMQIPDWHQNSVVPFTSTVQHVMVDPMNPTEFYVFPGNDGTGKIEAMVAMEPTLVTIPSSDPTVLANYTDTIDMAPIYKSVLLDYVMHRAFAVDMQMAGSAQRATMYYQSFLNKLGVRRQVEAVANPDTA